jgi:hypothetical protein
LKQHFLIIDTETTQDGLVADFAAVICDRKGNILAQCAVLVNGVFTDSENHPLYFTSDDEGIWSKKGQDRRYKIYKRMVDNGSRMIASVPAINAWLCKAVAAYNPTLTAYNLAFDTEKCANTGIDLTIFKSNFCLWQAAFTLFAHLRTFRQMVLETHSFNPPTKFGNMTFKTNAEVMARFVTGNHTLEDEPHTALEDIIFYELPILKAVFSKKSFRWLMANIKPYSWKDTQVKDWFKAK